MSQTWGAPQGPQGPGGSQGPGGPQGPGGSQGPGGPQGPHEPYGPSWAGEPEGPWEWLPALDLPEPGRQRRLTVLLRLLLLVPHAIVLFFLGVGAFFVALVGWFAALVLGRLPEGLYRYLSAYVAYEARVGASAMLLVDRYPPFALHPGTYPVRYETRPTHLNRLAVLFRVILVIPAAIIQSLVTSGWWALCFVWWLITLVLGRMPRPLFEATAATLRYSLRTTAYWLLITPAYPKRFFGDDPGEGDGVSHSASRPLLVGTAGKVLLVLFLLLGLFGGGFGSTHTSPNGDDDTSVLRHSEAILRQRAPLPGHHDPALRPVRFAP